MNKLPVEIVYGVLAMAGGMARYLTAYEKGKVFAVRYFLASTFISGFSGYMFALLGISLDLPTNMNFIMAGIGGFMGEQALKFVAEYITQKFK